LFDRFIDKIATHFSRQGNDHFSLCSAKPEVHHARCFQWTENISMGSDCLKRFQKPVRGTRRQRLGPGLGGQKIPGSFGGHVEKMYV